MMLPVLSSIIINTSHPEEMLKFYTRLGLEFECKPISQGGQCHRSFLGPVELTLYEAAGKPIPHRPDLQLTFRVNDLDQMAADLGKIHGVECLMDPTLLPDGKKAIFLDPDGRAIELIEA